VDVVTTLSGVYSADLGVSEAASWDGPSVVGTDGAGSEAMRPYIELARELVSRLGLTQPASTASRRSVE